MKAATSQRTLSIRLLLRGLQTFAANVCNGIPSGRVCQGRRGRAAHDQVRAGARPRAVAVAVSRSSSSSRSAAADADLVVRDADRGQRRREAVGERHVVEADHRHLARAVDPAGGEDVVAAERHQVVARHDRRERRVGVEQLLAQARALGLGEGAAERARAPARAPPAACRRRSPRGGRGRSRRPAGRRDGRSGGGRARRGARRPAARRRWSSAVADGRLPSSTRRLTSTSGTPEARDLVEQLVVGARGGGHEAVDLAGAHRLEVDALAHRVVVGVGDQRRVAGLRRAGRRCRG